MRIALVSLYPQIFTSLEYGIPGIAQKKGQLQLEFFDPRDETQDTHRTVDDKPYGGGPGMVLKAEPLYRAICKAKQACPAAKVIYLAPNGSLLTQATVRGFAKCSELILVLGRFEGIDQRVIDELIDEVWSIGDYVLSGGEIPAMVIVDAIARLLPGVIGDEASHQEDSFSEGAPFLEHPHYTRPDEWLSHKVPAPLLSGNHQQIARWRLKHSLGQTWLIRPELLEQALLTCEQKALLNEFKLEYQDRY